MFVYKFIATHGEGYILGITELKFTVKNEHQIIWKKQTTTKNIECKNTPIHLDLIFNEIITIKSFVFLKVQ